MEREVAGSYCEEKKKTKSNPVVWVKKTIAFTQITSNYTLLSLQVYLKVVY